MPYKKQKNDRKQAIRFAVCDLHDEFNSRQIPPGQKLTLGSYLQCNWRTKPDQKLKPIPTQGNYPPGYLRQKASVTATIIKFLGVYIDQHLEWKTHVNFIAAKVSKSVGLLYKAKDYLPSNSLLTLYYALIYPYLTYSNLILASTYVTNLQRRYLLQKRAVRAISKADYKASSKPLFANLKILDVFSIYSFQLSSFMYLYQNDALPISFT